MCRVMKRGLSTKHLSRLASFRGGTENNNVPSLVDDCTTSVLSEVVLGFAKRETATKRTLTLF